MKRIGEFILGLTGILVTLCLTGLTFLGMNFLNDPNRVSIMRVVDVEALRYSVLIFIIIGTALSIIALVPTILILKNKKSILSGSLFLAIGTIIIPFGQYISGILFIIAGLLSLLRIESKQ